MSASRVRRPYPTDVRDDEWALIQDLVSNPTDARRRRVEPREVVNALLYLSATGHPWQQLPRGFPYWVTVQYYYDKWTRDGTWVRVYDALCADANLQSSRATEISVGRPWGAWVRSLLTDVAQTALLALLLFLAFRALVQNLKVEGVSMVPTLESGQFLLVNRLAYARSDGTWLEHAFAADSGERGGPMYVFDSPRRGDIIAFRLPPQPNVEFVKRIIGVPGDAVEVRSGDVYLNGELLDEPYIRNEASYDQAEQVVPPGFYYVLGDNRPNSSDSHEWGLVPADNLVGKAWLRYWPPAAWGPVPSGAAAT